MLPRARRDQLLILSAATLLLTGCDLLAVTCTTELRPNLLVEVRDQATGRPAAFGATGEARHSSGVLTEFMSWDSLRLTAANWDRERAGRYSVVVRKPGFVEARSSVTVTEDQCHVRTGLARIELVRDATADAVSPIRLLQGNQVVGRPLTTAVRVIGDTLEISGAARAPCSVLRAVAFRRIGQWHIQMEPESWTPLGSGCINEPLRPFEVRYLLTPGRTRVLLTAPTQTPVLVFDQMVSPG